MKKSNKFLSITLILTLLISIFSFAGIIDYTVKAASDNLPKIDFDTVNSNIWHKDGFWGIGANKTNIYKNTTATYLYGSSKQSAKFTSSGTSSIDTKHFSFTDNNIGTDWSYGDTIVLPIYNAKKGTDSVNLVFVTSVSGSGYYYEPLKLDWSGWKLVKIPKSAFAGKGGGDQTWSNINSFYINSNGWGTHAIAESIEIYIDSVYLTSNKSTGETYVDFKDVVLTDASGMEKANASGSDSFMSARFTASGSAKSSAPVLLEEYCISSDWSSGKALSVNVYNKNANGQKVNIVLTKDATTANTTGYTLLSFNLNHTGWKTIDIPFYKLVTGGSNPGLSGLKAIYINVGGFGDESAISNVDFCIADIELKSAGQFVTEAISDSVAVYAGSTKAYNKLSAVTLDNAPVHSNNILYVPLSLFEKLFGAEADASTLNFGGMTFEFKENSDKANIGAYTHTLSAPARVWNSEIYVPISDICEIYDIPIHLHGRLAVMGSESNIDFIEYYNAFGVNEIDEQIASKFDKINSSDYTEADCDAVIANKLKVLVGNEELNDISDSAIASKIETVTKNANSVRALLNKTEGATELFTDQTSTATSHMSTTADRIKQMAFAYGAYGSTLYQDNSLLEDILYSLEWFYQNRFGEDEIAGKGWHSTTGYNWHDWRIATPYSIMYTMMIVRDSLTDNQISNYLKCFHYVSPDTYSSGANYMDACELLICAAALEKNPELIGKYKEKAEGNFMYVDNARYQESQLDSARQEYTTSKGHGFYTDGSYLFHTLHAMNGTYGGKHLTSAAGIISLLEGTKFEISKQCIDNLADWLVNSFDGSIYGTRMFRMFLGRSENPSETSNANTIVSVALKCFELFDEEDKIRVGSIIKHYAGSNPAKYSGVIDIEYLDTYNEIVSSNIYDEYRYDFANVFGNVDKVVQRRDGWGMGISMSSSRIFNYESINGLNKDGWYLGDGRTELILKSEANTSATNYWKNINYYRLPGTTVDTQERKLASVAQGNEYLSSKDFVGGVELDEKYATAAMHLESYHNESDFGRDSGEYGGKNPAHTSDLTAKKSYFMFDNEIYCLGAEVNASNNNNAEVLTIVENKPVISIGSSRLKATSAGTKESNDLDIKKFGAGNNWSGVSTIQIPVYSAVNNGQIVNVIFSKAETDILSGYYFTSFTVDWTGWKVVELSKSKFTPSRGIKNWSDINSMYFNIGGWQSTGYANTDLCFADIKALDANGKVVHIIPFTRSDVASAANLSFTTDIVYDEVTPGSALSTNLGEMVISANSENSLNGVTWANSNNVGYVFHEEYSNGDLKANSTSGGYLETYFSHGINPENGTYAYALLPNMTKEQTKAYAENPDVTILANNGDVQAVRYNKKNITSIVFWNAGSFDGITVSDPMMVMIKDGGKDITMSVSDPTHKLESANITIEKALLISYADSRITQSYSGDTSSFDIDFSETLGKSLEAKLKAAEPVTNVVFKNAAGNKITQYVSQSEEGVTADVTVANLSGADYFCNIYAAVYDIYGKLEEVQLKPASVLANGGEFTTQFTITPTSDTKRIQIYVWDASGNKPCATLYRN